MPATRGTGMEAEEGITTEGGVGMVDRTTGDTGAATDAEDSGVVDLVEVALEAAREASVGVMPMVEVVLEEVMVMAEVVDAGVGTTEGLDRMAARMVEDLVWVVEEEVVAEQVVCRVDQEGVGTLLL